MATRPWLVAGHSHATALVGSQVAPAPELRPVAGQRDLVALAGPWPRDAAYWHALIANSGNRVSIVVFGGNEHYQHFLIRPEPPFDFVASADPAAPVEPGAVLVPEAMVRTKFSATLDALGWTLGQMRARRGARPVVAGTPPPKEDDGFLTAVLAAEPHLVAAASRHGTALEAVVVTPFRLRMKLWGVLQDCLREKAEAADTAFVAVPDSVYTREHGLAREFWANDVSHANEAYGAIMLDHLTASLAAA